MSTTTEILQIHLNSKYADKIYNGSYNSYCEWFLPVIEIPLQHTIYLSCQHAVIPYTFYNIDSSNNTLKYLLNGTTYTVTIDEGNYNIYQLVTFLKSNLNLITVTYNPINSKLTFTNSTYDFSFLNTSTCLEILGFNPNTIVSSISRTLTSSNVINLQSKHCICIQSNFHTGSINSVNKNESSIICSIPINVPPYSMLTYQNHNNLKYNLFNNVITSITLKLCDQTNKLINLNGCHWSVSIQLEVVKFVDE